MNLLPKPVLLVSSGIFHPPVCARDHLARILNDIPDCEFDHISSLNKIARIPLEKYCAMVLYFHHKKLSPEALTLFDKFVSDGGGVLAIHSASASFKKQDHYFKILGGQFRKHGPVETFQINPENNPNPIFGDLSQFVIEDELYLHTYDPLNTIHFYTEVTGTIEPIVWTRTYGKGRICYIALGHTISSMKHPKMTTILQDGLLWTCAGRSYQETTFEP